ncbi:MAG: oligosaccharide flippase family protein [Bacteroides sp.]|nr:oligosaccharide flippase family protein [Bacteroides sp.]
MAELKSLAKDTAIYGMSSIVGRFLNYLLVPLYTYVMPVESGDYGVVTNVYAITALLLVLLTYGMETGFFRFANKKDEDPQRVYSTILISVAVSSVAFLLLFLPLSEPLSAYFGYAGHPEYLFMMMIVVALDAFQSIPFAYLRYQRRPWKFMAVKMYFILFTLAMNVLALIGFPGLQSHFPDLMGWYHVEDRVMYIFLINLIATASQMFWFIPELRGFRYVFDVALWKRLLTYSFPIMILGIAGILNQTIDKIIFPILFHDPAEAQVQLGIYGAAAKVAMIMAMFTQAFRYAYEPFVFGRSQEKDNRQMYARAMKFFIIFALLGFLAVMFYLDILKFILPNKGYWVGLKVVPIAMAAEIFIGIYFNLSFWYKLIDETRWGAYFSLIGLVIIVTLNVLFVPRYGYIASAWAGFCGYAVVTVISYVVGQKKYPIRYDLKSIGMYVMLAGILYVAGEYIYIEHLGWRMLYRTLLLSLFVVYVIRKDLPLREIPVINKFIKKK